MPWQRGKTARLHVDAVHGKTFALVNYKQRRDRFFEDTFDYGTVYNLLREDNSAADLQPIVAAARYAASWNSEVSLYLASCVGKRNRFRPFTGDEWDVAITCARLVHEKSAYTIPPQTLRDMFAIERTFDMSGLGTTLCDTNRPGQFGRVVGGVNTHGTYVDHQTLCRMRGAIHAMVRTGNYTDEICVLSYGGIKPALPHRFGMSGEGTLHIHL